MIGGLTRTPKNHWPLKISSPPFVVIEKCIQLKDLFTYVSIGMRARYALHVSCSDSVHIDSLRQWFPTFSILRTICRFSKFRSPLLKIEKLITLFLYTLQINYIIQHSRNDYFCIDIFQKMAL